MFWNRILDSAENNWKTVMRENSPLIQNVLGTLEIRRSGEFAPFEQVFLGKVLRSESEAKFNESRDEPISLENLSITAMIAFANSVRLWRINDRWDGCQWGVFTLSIFLHVWTCLAFFVFAISIGDGMWISLLRLVSWAM